MLHFNFSLNSVTVIHVVGFSVVCLFVSSGNYCLREGEMWYREYRNVEEEMVLPSTGTHENKRG